MVSGEQIGAIALIGAGGYFTYKSVSGSSEEEKEKQGAGGGVKPQLPGFGRGSPFQMKKVTTQASEKAMRGTPATSQEARGRVSRGSAYAVPSPIPSKPSGSTQTDQATTKKDKVTTIKTSGEGDIFVTKKEKESQKTPAERKQESYETAQKWVQKPAEKYKEKIKKEEPSKGTVSEYEPSFAEKIAGGLRDFFSSPF